MVLAVAVVLVVLRRDEALDREIGCPFQQLLGRALGCCCVAELRVACREKRQMGLVGAANPLERFDRLAVAPRDEISAAEMTPEALGMIGVEAHRLLDPFDAFFRLANPGQYLALLHDDEVVVWIERQRSLLVVERLVVVVVHRQVHGGENAVHVAVVLVERQRQRQFPDHRARCVPGRPVCSDSRSSMAGAPTSRQRAASARRSKRIAPCRLAKSRAVTKARRASSLLLRSSARRHWHI